MAPLTRKRKSELDAASLMQMEEESKVTDSKRQKKLPVRAKEDEAVPDADGPAEPAKGTMKVFTDDDDDDDDNDNAKVSEPLPTMKQPIALANEEEDDDEDSDDEAPEAISTSQAASSVKKSAHAAQKAAQEQAAAEKRKRQQRDALFKQQAEERKKQEEESRAPLATPTAQTEDARPGDPQDETLGRRRRAAKIEIPDVLPADYLTDSSSDDEEEEDPSSAHVLPKKRKISTIDQKMSRRDRGPRDEQVGSTVYRVTKKVDDRLVPKAKKHAKASKELLLKRNRAVVKPRSGFFTKK